ncbi:VWA domain-containing protein [Alkaliphilus serpentinus]|uniref:VWA domain-containing protein n=1 Tax=Alkaliphilus serpentinus TaxID=1482731 RepID=UPI001A9BF1C5|nr:VWA domain-containing protein [Alkaliphilus serpentinus]
MNRILNKKGFTLLEVILSLALLGMVILIAVSMLNFSTRAHKTTIDEYRLQSEMRVATEKINEFIRYSTAVFTVPMESFKEDKLAENWNYFGVSEDKTEIIHYLYNEATGNHDKKIIVTSEAFLNYNLSFHKKDLSFDSKLLSFALEGFIVGAENKRIVIESEVEALNALQVVDRGTDGIYATALAYRTDERPKPENARAAVSMVLDISGSMALSMNGSSANYPNRRVDIMKNEAIDLIEGFSEMETVDVSLIPFSTSANNPSDFYDASVNEDFLLDEINDLTAFGGTNIGDGMRRGFHQLKNYNNDHTDFDIMNYVILLVDGDPTFSSVKPQTDAVRNRQWPGYSNYWLTRTNEFTDISDYKLDDGNVDDNVFLQATNRRTAWIRTGFWPGQGYYQDQIYLRSTDDFSSSHTMYSSPGWVEQSNNSSVPLQFYGNEIIGTGFSTASNIADSMNYVEYIGENLIDNGEINIKTFVIGFTAVPEEVARATEIANICNGTYYSAQNQEDLAEIFEEVRVIILSDLWHIYGPQ